MEKPTEIDKAWLASAIDGEGTIRFYTTKHGRKYANVTVYNSNYDYVAKASDIMDCKIYKHSTSNNRLTKKQMYQAMATNRASVEYVLTMIEPYLVIKRDKALAILKWYAENPPANLSDVMKRTWNNYSVKERSVRLAKIRKGIVVSNKTPETRHKRSIAMVKRWNDPEQRQILIEATVKGGIATANKYKG
jgi:hypothetical protein